VVQDAWVRIQAAERRVPLVEPLRYFYRTVRNLALDGYRAEQREGLRKGQELGDAAETVADTTPSPETAAIARDELRQVLEGLEELPERMGRAVKLYKFEGLKLREVAERMGISVALAHSLVLDGIEHCAQRVARRA
jgi:RNA polymerase sigma-70 factor (ECF subfamily)